MLCAIDDARALSLEGQAQSVGASDVLIPNRARYHKIARAAARELVIVDCFQHWRPEYYALS